MRDTATLWLAGTLHRLRAARERLDLQAANLADRAGIDPSTVSRWERGTRGLSLGSLERYAAAAGLRVTVLFWPDQGDELGEGDAALLEALAGALPHVPPVRRRALVNEARLWRDAAGR